MDEFKVYFWFVVFIILHELSHFFVAKKLGYLASRIHLTFFGASLEGLDDFALTDEIKIVLAGPMFNLAIVIICYLCFWFYPESYHYLNEILIANISIFIFNFLPIFPLDLGRLILAILSRRHTRLQAIKLTRNFSFGVLCGLFALFLLSFFFDFNFTFGFVCVNLMILLFKTSKDTSYKRSVFVLRKFKRLKSGLLERKIYIPANTPDASLFKFIDDFHYVNFVFIDENYFEVDRLSEIELYHKLKLI